MRIFFSLMLYILMRYTPLLASASAAVNLTLILAFDLSPEDVRFYSIVGSLSASIGWMMVFITDENVRSLLIEIIDSGEERE